MERRQIGSSSSNCFTLRDCATAGIPLITCRMRKVSAISLLIALLFAPLGCNKGSEPSGGSNDAKKGKKPKIVYITNGVDPFWNVAAAGTKAAAKEFNAD